MSARCNVASEIEAAGTSDTALAQPRHQVALGRLPLRTMLRQIQLNLFRRQRTQLKHHRPRAERRQQFAGILRQQKDRGELRRLLQHLEQRVRRLFHKRRVGENVNPLPTLRRPVMDGLNHSPHLIHFDHHLRGVGRDHQHVGMCLHKKPRFFLVCVAQILPRFNSLGEPRTQICRLSNPRAVRTLPAEIRQTIGRHRRQAVQRLRQHQCQGVLA